MGDKIINLTFKPELVKMLNYIRENYSIGYNAQIRASIPILYQILTENETARPATSGSTVPPLNTKLKAKASGSDPKRIKIKTGGGLI